MTGHDSAIGRPGHFHGPRLSDEKPTRFISGMVKVPVVTTLAIEDLEISPAVWSKRPPMTGRSAPHVPEQRKGDLDEIIARPRPVEQRPEQDEQEDKGGRNPDGDAEHALGGQPLLAHMLERGAAMGDHVGHVGPGEGVEQERQRDEQQRRPQRPARGFEQQHEPHPRNDQIEKDRRARTTGQIVIENIKIGGGKGGQRRQNPIDRRHLVERSRAPCGVGGKPRGDGHGGKGQPLVVPGQRKADPIKRKTRRCDRIDPGKHRQGRRAPYGAGEGRIGQKQGKGQMDGARLGVVENEKVEDEGERRGIPELEQRPRQRHAEQNPARNPVRCAGAGIGHRDQIFGIVPVAHRFSVAVRTHACSSLSSRSRAFCPLLKTQRHAPGTALSPAHNPRPDYIRPASS